MSRVLISAAHKSSGKTTISIGLCAALRKRGVLVQPFKKGPDYIDPLWLTQSAGRPCHNLDFFLQSEHEIIATYSKHMRGAEIGLIEGNKGLYDGLNLDGSNSNAALACLLRAPVVLVIDARGMTRGIAPLILGYQAFDREVNIAGVILNNLGGRRHEAKLRAVIEHYTTVPVVGAVQHSAELEIVERHLGLVPSNEVEQSNRRIAAIAEQIEAQVDLERLLAVARTAPSLPAAALPATSRVATPRVRIGIARDAAFAFYYPGDLDALRAAGAELVFLDALRDTRLPALDGLFIGGGFPETQMDALAANASLRHEIRRAIEAGLPTYAECGGLMYLGRSIRWREHVRDMVGLLPFDSIMHEKPVGRGYVQLRETGRSPWPTKDSTESITINAHEFHYSSLENVQPDLIYAYEVLRGTGIDGKRDGIIYKNLLASYAHLRDVETNHWTKRFVNFVRNCQRARAPESTAVAH